MIDVKSYGAVGNGTTDDTVAIQAAIDSQLDAIYFPPGTYIVSQLRMKFGTVFVGSGWKSTLKLAPNSGTDMIVADSLATSWVQIRDLNLDGNKDLQTVPSNAINWSWVPSQGDRINILQNVRVAKFKGNAIVLDVGSLEIRVIGCYIINCDGDGLVISGTDNAIIGTTIGYCNNGVVINGANNRLTNVKAFRCGNSGFVLSNSNSHLTGCESQDNVGDGFLLQNSYNVCLNGCYTDSNFGDAYHLETSNNCVVTGHVLNSGRAVHTSAVHIGSSISKSVVNVTYNPNAVATALIGATVNNEVKVGLQPVASITYDPPNLPKGSQTVVVVPVSGVSLGDFVAATFSQDLQGIQLNAYVSSAGNVSCIFQNGTSSNINIASGTLMVRRV